MKKGFFNFQSISRRWITTMVVMMVSIMSWGQEGGEKASEELVNLGFENVRWTENDEERIYTIENNVYKAQGVGIAKAIDVIQTYGLPADKQCKVIVTHLDVPQLALTYQPISIADTASFLADKRHWKASYELGNSWKEVKKEKKKNSSRYKIDILIYPQLSFQNMDITKIYQVMFTLNPAIEVSLWRGMKLTGQVILPLTVDTKGYAAYPPIYKKVRPGFLTLAQRFRLPFNIKGKATVGYFNQDQYGFDLQLNRPFKDERFSVQARLGYTGWGYWDGFSLKYNDQYLWTWEVGGSFFWPQYDVLFSLKAEKYLLGEKGVRFDMVRHFKYASVGFYAMKAEKANSNGGFLFQVTLPPLKQRRHKYIPRISTSRNMGIIYNAGNERLYYRQYRSETSDKTMEQNDFNTIYIENKMSNY